MTDEIKPKPLMGFAAHPENINLKGRPHKAHSITETIRRMMDEKPEIKRALAVKIFDMAIKGDITAIKTIWNYMDGMPQQEVKGEFNLIKTIIEDYGSGTKNLTTTETEDSVRKE